MSRSPGETSKCPGSLLSPFDLRPEINYQPCMHGQYFYIEVIPATMSTDSESASSRGQSGQVSGSMNGNAIT